MTPGEAAYIEDCRRCPNYHDGATRRAWAALPDYAKASWEKNPTPRTFRTQPADAEQSERAGGCAA